MDNFIIVAIMVVAGVVIGYNIGTIRQKKKDCERVKFAENKVRRMQQIMRDEKINNPMDFRERD